MVKLALLSFFALCSLCTSQYVHPYMYGSVMPSMYMIPPGGMPHLPQFQYAPHIPVVPTTGGHHFDAPDYNLLPVEPKIVPVPGLPNPGDQDKPKPEPGPELPKPGDQDKPKPEPVPELPKPAEPVPELPKPGDQDKPKPKPEPHPDFPYFPHFPYFPYFPWSPYFHHFPPVYVPQVPHSNQDKSGPMQPYPMPDVFIKDNPISPPGTLDMPEKDSGETETPLKATGTHQAIIKGVETTSADVKENKTEEVKENGEKKSEASESCWSQLNKVDKCVNNILTAYSFRKFDEISPECCGAINSISKECHEKTLGSFHDNFFVSSLKNQCSART